MTSACRRVVSARNAPSGRWVSIEELLQGGLRSTCCWRDRNAEHATGGKGRFGNLVGGSSALIRSRTAALVETAPSNKRRRGLQLSALGIRVARAPCATVPPVTLAISQAPFCGGDH